MATLATTATTMMIKWCVANCDLAQFDRFTSLWLCRTAVKPFPSIFLILFHHHHAFQWYQQHYDPRIVVSTMFNNVNGPPAQPPTFYHYFQPALVHHTSRSDIQQMVYIRSGWTSPNNPDQALPDIQELNCQKCFLKCFFGHFYK